MKKKLMLAGFITIAALGTWFTVKHNAGSVQSDSDGTWVQAETVRTSQLPLEAHAIGTLIARSVEITPEVSGHVAKILFQDGTFVKNGALLVQLDDAAYKAKLDSANAEYSLSQSDYNRKIILGKQGIIARQAIDAAESDLKVKRASAQENAVNLSKMQLTAPFAGIVGKSKVNPGDYINTGISVVTLTDTKNLRIEYNVPEKFLPLLKLGQSVKIITATYPDKAFYGKVAFISPTINTDNRSISLYAAINNDDNSLAPGMFVNVSQSLNANEKALLIPARSLVPVLDGEQVYKIVDGKAYAVNVLLGKRSGDQVEITQGLTPGDVIITDGQLKVRNNQPVKIKS